MRGKTLRSSDSVFDASLLPRSVAVAEAGFHIEILLKPVMEGKFRTVVEGHGWAQRLTQGGEVGLHRVGDGAGRLAIFAMDDQQPGGTLLGHQKHVAGLG